MQNEAITFDLIKRTIKDGQLASAHQMIETYLVTNHNDIRAIKLRESLRKKIYKQNVKKVRAGIQKSKPLWKEKKYSQLLDLYLQLQQFAPKYAPLEKQISKAYKKLSAEEKKTSNSVFSNIENTIKAYLETNNYKEALDLLTSTLSKDSKNPALNKLFLDTKRKIIDLKLTDNKNKINNADVQSAYDFIKELYQIEPSYYKIQKLYFKYYKKLKDYYSSKKEIFEKDAKRQIKILFNTKEYEKTITACKELQRAYNESKFAKQYIQKSKNKIENLNFKKAYEKIS